MKKAGILTLYHKTYNYGAQLQAYALQKTIEDLSYCCEQISFKWYNFAAERQYAEWIGGRNSAESFRQFSCAIKHSERVYTADSIADCADDYDIFICGSDQIWGCFDSMPYYILPQFLLAFAPRNKVKLSYGASMGGIEVPHTLMPILRHGLSELDAISIRESSAIPFISSLTDKTVSVVLDPVMLLDIREWDKIAVLPNEQSDYVLCYVLGENTEIENIARQAANRLNCGLKMLSYSEKDTAGPGEFIGLIKNALRVITNSFHGMVFSILYHKRFFAIKIDGNDTPFSTNHRITDLLNCFGLIERLTGVNTSYQEIVDDLPIDYSVVDVTLTKRRAESLTFLKNALAAEKSAEKAIVSKKNCYGCGACAVSCPAGCIEMTPDELGFPYPAINDTTCTKCGFCEYVCPARNPIAEKEDREVMAYAAFNNDETVRMQSSSGGVFSVFADAVINRGGVVFGATFDVDMSVHHKIARTLSGVAGFRGSKYVQSRVENTYKEAESCLNRGELVLYSGTPCQIEGLKSYLKREYTNLLAIDLICHGVSSPRLWQKYIGLKQDNANSAISGAFFRDKKYGWLNANTAMRLTYANNREEVNHWKDDSYLYLFLNDVFQRPSCYHCGVKKIGRESDLTVADFWGIENLLPELCDDKGISLVLIQSEKGLSFFDSVLGGLTAKPVPVEPAIKRNPLVNSSAKIPASRNYLLSIFEESTIETLYYEHKAIEQENRYDELDRILTYEIIRNGIILKLSELQAKGLSLKDNSLLTGKVIVYGAGKVGRLLSEMLDDKVLCFIDRLPSNASCAGFPVYKLGDNGLDRTIKNSGQITFLITPIWDMDMISDKIQRLYPQDARIISIQQLLNEGMHKNEQ